MTTSDSQSQVLCCIIGAIPLLFLENSVDFMLSIPRGQSILSKGSLFRTVADLTAPEFIILSY
jgi:hypothetical protein